MENFMSFVEANYIWLIIIGVILVLSLIGYIAEKNGYKKVEKDAKEKDKENENIKKEEIKEISEPQEEPQEIIVEPEIDFNNFDTDVVLEEPKKKEKKSKKKDKKKKEEVKEVVPTFDDLNIVEQPVTVEPTINLDVKPLEEDLNAPLGEIKVEESPALEEIPADLYAPIGDVVKEEPLEVETLDVEDVKPIDASLPNLDTIKDTNEEVTNEDDIWKF